MSDLNIENGISEFGYTSEDIPRLVEGTVPQKRLISMGPDGEPTPEEIAMLYEQSMKIY